MSYIGPFLFCCALLVVILVIWEFFEDRSEHRARNRGLSMEQQNEDLRITGNAKIVTDDELDQLIGERFNELGSRDSKGPTGGRR